MTINCRSAVSIVAIILLAGASFACKEEAPPTEPKPAVVSRKIDTAPQQPAPASKQAPTAAKAAAEKSEPVAAPDQASTTTPAEETAAQAAAPAAAATAEAEEGIEQTAKQRAAGEAPAVAGEASQGPAPTMEEILDKAAEQGLYRARFYQAEGKIDPFKPLFQERKVVRTVEAPEEKQKRIPQTPLEKISLEQLTLVGIIQMASGNKALVEEASGRGYVVKEGTYIGLNGGRIARIEGDRVVVEEEEENLMGKVSTVEKELKLQKPLGE